ncbi:MAG: hypothetical protein JRJ14_07920, partial [Deltaproteobacteria bacterium]|nr:hypothetical protein [Deltaproteobacteria bacterium]
CVSKRGIVGLAEGIMYPSPDGMIYVPTAGLPQIVTQPFFKKKEWQDMINPSSLIGVPFDDRYYGFFSEAGIERNESGVMIFDPKEPGATFTTLSFIGTGAHSDLETDDMYFIQDGVIVKYEGGSGRLVYTWLSKLFTTTSPICFKAAKVKLTFGEGATTTEKEVAIEAAITSLEVVLAATLMDVAVFGKDNNYVSGSLGGGAVGEYTVGGGPYMNAMENIQEPVTVNMNVYAYYDNGTGAIARHLVHTENLAGSKPFRIGNIAKGYLADQWELEFNCNDVIIHEATLGTSVRSLAQV